MDRDPLADLHRWLTAEGRDDAEADAAFRGMFASVPRARPSPGFADRVVQASRVDGLLPVASPWGHVWLRLTVSAGLVMVGLAVFGASVATPIPDLSFLFGMWIAVVTGGTAWLGRVLEVGLSIWRLGGQLGTAAALVAATPEVSFVLAADGALALVAFLCLRRLLLPREEMVSW
jgi:hypothetical protein